MYFVRLHPICRRYRDTLGRNGSASPLRRPSISLLKHCLRGSVYIYESSLGPIQFYSRRNMCLCVVSRPKNKPKTRGKKSSQSNSIQFIRWHPPHFYRPSFSMLLQHYLSYLDRCALRSPIPYRHLLLGAAAIPAGGVRTAPTRP